MNRRTLSVLQVSTADHLGGAERVAWNLFTSYRARGVPTWLAVGRKKSNDPDVFELRNDLATTGWRQFWWIHFHQQQPSYSRSLLARLLARFSHRLASSQGRRDRREGLEDFNYPGTSRLMELAPFKPDIIHCHNLHGGYFDLRELPALSRSRPVMLTLHDAWLLAGHCAHSFDCDRWRIGCGSCPDLSIYPAIRRDATAENWRRKSDIIAGCRLYVAAPSQWLMNKVACSMLAPAIIQSRVIPNGVDRTIFHPADRANARAKLGIPTDHFVLLFAAHGVKQNPFKDYATLNEAMHLLAAKPQNRKITFIALGERSASRCIGNAELHFVPPVSDPAHVASYYQAADVYVHAAKADTFPNSVIEALACGLPVVATAVGGIPEQVRSWPETGATGFLTASGRADELAAACERLIVDTRLRLDIGCNAAASARHRFGLEQQSDAYLDWYQTIQYALARNPVQRTMRVLPSHPRTRQLA